MKKILSVMSLALMLLALGWAQTASAKTVYLQPNSNWTQDGARFALYVFSNEANTWIDMTAVGESGVYSASFDDTTYPKMIFVRMNGGTTENNWDNMWNQSNDLDAPTENHQLYTLAAGAWSNGDFTVTPYFGYVMDFNTTISTSNHDFSVGKNWGHIVGEAVIDGDTYYMSYSYNSASGVDGTGCLLGYSQQGGSYYEGYSPVTDVLVTPLVSGTVALYAKTSYSTPQYVEFYQVSEDGKTLGSLIQKFTLSEMDDSDITGWKFLTLNLSEEQRLGIRVSNAYIDNFMATSATIVPEKKLTINGVTSLTGSTPVACNQNEDGSAVVTANVKVKNTGDVAFVAGETENYTLSFGWKQYYGTTVTTYDDVTFDISEDLAVNEEKTIETTFNVPAEVVSAIFSNNSSGYFYLKVKENVSETVSSAQLQCQLKEYASKFIFDKAGTTYYSSSSATSTPIDFGKISEATTLNYEIYNSGSAPLTINSFTLPEPYTSDVPATPFTVAGGEKKVIAITLPADNPGIFAGDLEIVYTNFGKVAATYTLGISGTIVDPTKNLITFSNADNTNGQYPAGSIHSDQVYISSKTEGGVTNYYLQSTNTTTKFITPKLTATAGENFTFDTWYTSYSSSAAVTVYTSTDRVNWTQIIKATGLGSAVKTFTATIEDEGDYYLAFELTGNALLDNIYGLTLAEAPEHDWYFTEEANVPTSGMQNTDYTASITLKNISADADNLTATLYMDGEAVATQDVSLEGNAMTAAEGTGRPGTYGMSNIAEPTTIDLTFKPHTVGTLPAYIELKAGETVVKTEEVEVTIAEEVALSGVQVGESKTTNGSVPFYFLWADHSSGKSMSDFAYSKEELAAYGIVAGSKIKSIKFTGNPTTTKTFSSGLTVDVWVGMEENGTLTSSTAGTADTDNMFHQTIIDESSYSFTANIPVEFTITFDEPLVYDGTSEIRVFTNTNGHGSYNTLNFPADNTYANGYYAYGTNSFSSTGVTPVAYFDLEVSTPKLFGTVADISGKTQEAPLHLAGAKVTIRSTEDDVEYTGISDENGNYCIDIIQDDLVYDELICELDGYADESYTERYGKNVTFTEDCDLWVADYPFYLDSDETISGCFWSPGMYPCVELTISESTYATFYYENDAYMIPDGLTAYTVKKNGNELTLTEETALIPAACPVVINGEPGTYQFRWSDSSSSFSGENDLIGSEEGGKFGNDGAKYYVLSWKDKNKNVDEVGFYFQSGSKGKYAKVKAHQAYLRVPSSQANDAGYTFTFDEGTTGIAAVETDSSVLDPNQPMYNLAGQRVGKDYRGVVIQNGKKVIKK
ncbi:MAG: hypothetical protein IKT00_08650 [Prevotella sp.]|nr:hypothetical protein [Prevotella sp.]